MGGYFVQDIPHPVLDFLLHFIYWQLCVIRQFRIEFASAIYFDARTIQLIVFAGQKPQFVDKLSVGF